MVNSPVLVLNQNYEPINVSRVRRAVVLVIRGKAETLENDSGMIHTARSSIPMPSVIRLVYMVKRPRPEKKLTRREDEVLNLLAGDYPTARSRSGSP